MVNKVIYERKENLSFSALGSERQKGYLFSSNLYRGGYPNGETPQNVPSQLPIEHANCYRE
jgi:hypothetical protein